MRFELLRPGADPISPNHLGRDLLRQRLLAAFGTLSLDAIGKPEIQAFAGSLARDGVQTKGPMSLLKTILRAALDAGVISSMPELPKVR